VVIDESQLLTPDCIELLRYLHDHHHTRFALVLVGGNGTWRVLSREPMLASRIYRRVRFQALSRHDVLATIPTFHPLYRNTNRGLLELVDDVFAHGNLRNWAAFTRSALTLIHDTGRHTLDEQIVRNVFALHGGSGQNH
jgi:DNA transposition AAA+ family ATPase